MTRLHATVIAVALCAAPQPANAAPSDFDRIVRSVEAQTGVSRPRLSGFGFLFRASTWLTRPAGASDMQVAIFNPVDGQHGFSSAAFEDVLTRTLDRT